MALCTVNNVKIKGISAAVPKLEVSNWDYEFLSDNEKKLLIKTTGVEKKRVVDNGVVTSDLCFYSANRLLSELDWNKDDIGIIIFLSQSRDYYLPATSIILQNRLGLPKTCLAFDISLGCSGYIYGLSVIGSMMSAMGISKGLLMVGDISSLTCSKEDKSTYPLFGDAGTTTAIEFEEGRGFDFSLKSDGGGHKAIIIPAGGVRNVVNKDSFEKKKVGEGIIRNDLNLALNGLNVFNFSINEVPKSIVEFFNHFNVNQGDYDYFVMHQANKLMNETIRKKLKFSEEKVPYSLAEYGNTSSASIPLTIVTQLKKQVRLNSLKLLLSGFGVGLSWGVVSVDIDKIICSDLIEV